MADYPMILEELEGLRRRVVLDASALPFQGMEAGVSMRMVRTHYPGSRRASVQVLGTEEAPILLQGRFSDVLLGAAGGAEALVAELRGLLTGQRPVELTWGAVVRRGFVTRFTPRYQLRSVVGWELEFTPDEADDATVVAIPYQATTTTDVLTVLDVLESIVDSLDEAVAVSNALQAIL